MICFSKKNVKLYEPYFLIPDNISSYEHFYQINIKCSKNSKGSMFMIKVKMNTCLISILLASAALILAFICIISSNGNSSCDVLCTAVSVSNSDDVVNTIDLPVPANSRITKIYASMQQFDIAPIDGGRISILTEGGTGDTIFAHRFGKDPNIGSGGYETTLVQPLYVGTGDVVVRLFSFFEENLQTASFLELTVVYCPAAE